MAATLPEERKEKENIISARQLEPSVRQAVAQNPCLWRPSDPENDTARKERHWLFALRNDSQFTVCCMVASGVWRLVGMCVKGRIGR